MLVHYPNAKVLRVLEKLMHRHERMIEKMLEESLISQLEDQLVEIITMNRVHFRTQLDNCKVDKEKTKIKHRVQLAIAIFQIF